METKIKTAINYRKIKSQIRCERQGKRTQYFFSVTPEQEADDVMPIAAWSKKQLLDIIVYFTNHDVDWRGNRASTFSKHFSYTM